jgi:hypothetical protein
MASSRGKARYSGNLAKPIRRLRPYELKGAKEFEADIARYNEEMSRQEDDEIIQILSERLALLFAHYEIQDTNNYIALAVALAFDHLPGFSVEQQASKLQHGDYGAVVAADPTGRDREWGSDRVSRLLDDVERTKRDRRLTKDKQALQFLIRKDRYWRTPPNHRGTVEAWLKTLANHLPEARRVRLRADRMMKELEKIASDSDNKIPGNSSGI